MARQPVVRPDSTETRLNHDPPASAELNLTRHDHRHSDFSPPHENGAGSSSPGALDEVLRLVAQQACLATSASASAIAISDGGEIVCRATAGPHAPEPGTRLDSGSGLTGACVRTRQLQYCEDTDTDTRVNAAACRRLQVRSVLVIPLVYQDELLGIMEIFSPFPRAFAQHDLQNLEALAQVVLENLRSPAEPVSFPPADEPLFAGIAQSSPPGSNTPESNIPDSWTDTPVVVEPAAPLLELSAMRWEPPEAHAHRAEQKFPELNLPELDLPELDLPELNLPELDLPEPAPAPASSRRYRPSELFAPPVEALPLPEPFAPAPLPTPPRYAMAPLITETEAPQPANPAPVFHQVRSQPNASADEPRPPRRDWATAFLTITVIGVALLLGWMLGHAGWQGVLGFEKGSSNSSSRADASESTSADASDAVLPAAPKPTQTSNRPRASTPSASSFNSQRDGGLVVSQGGRVIFQQDAAGNSKGGDSRSSAAAADQPIPGDPVSLSPEVASAYLIRRVEPVYPEAARLRNIEGDVRLEALVGKDGAIQVLRLISGNSELAEAAADAVRQWRFRPYKLEGEAKPFSTRLTVSFRLQ